MHCSSGDIPGDRYIKTKVTCVFTGLICQVTGACGQTFLSAPYPILRDPGAFLSYGEEGTGLIALFVRGPRRGVILIFNVIIPASLFPSSMIPSFTLPPTSVNMNGFSESVPLRMPSLDATPSPLRNRPGAVYPSNIMYAQESCLLP